MTILHVRAGQEAKQPLKVTGVVVKNRRLSAIVKSGGGGPPIEFFVKGVEAWDLATRALGRSQAL
jgi:hypothetical protein